MNILWKDIQINERKEYMHAVKMDVLLLGDIFENYRKFSTRSCLVFVLFSN